jgi:(p)ppGpp synthase/HD superfamily hydrolase
MITYAQTNIQLFDQLRCEGYSNEEIACVRDAYELAMRLFAGLFLPSGKLFIDHVVGTASILASLRAPVEVVAAGLIHAAYFRGDLGGIRKSVSKAERLEMTSSVGAKVEEYVAGYDAMGWDSKTIPALRDGVDKLDRIDRYVLLIQLANELEHRLDFADLYSDNAEWLQRYMERYLPAMLDMARGLGFPALAAELAQAFSEAASGEIPSEARSRSHQPRSYIIPPNSYCKRRWIAVSQECVSGIYRLRAAIGLRTRLRRIVRRLIGDKRSLSHS